MALHDTLQHVGIARRIQGHSRALFHARHQASRDCPFVCIAAANIAELLFFTFLAINKLHDRGRGAATSRTLHSQVRGTAVCVGAPDAAAAVLRLQELAAAVWLLAACVCSWDGAATAERAVGWYT
jgi:hypothetical protein